MEGRVEISETYPKSEEIKSFYPESSCICRLYTVLAITFSRTAMFWLQQFITSISLVSPYSVGKHKILGINKKPEEINVHLIFCAFGHFYYDVVKRKHPCCLGVLKCGVPELVRFCIDNLLMYTFGTDPSLISLYILDFYCDFVERKLAYFSFSFCQWPI